MRKILILMKKGEKKKRRERERERERERIRAPLYHILHFNRLKTSRNSTEYNDIFSYILCAKQCYIPIDTTFLVIGLHLKNRLLLAVNCHKTSESIE
jgi:hypothetical protein